MSKVRWSSLALLCVFVGSLAGCGGSDDKSAAGGGASGTSGTAGSGGTGGSGGSGGAAGIAPTPSRRRSAFTSKASTPPTRLLG
ncbi:MAG: hypothetical protein U0165_16620 [Polyangiaceae bacterium]